MNEKNEYKRTRKSFSNESDTYPLRLKDDTNPIASALKIIAIIIFFLGFIAGFVLGRQVVKSSVFNRADFSFAIAFIYWAVSFISGMMFLGFAEIIQLLQDIKNKK